MHQDEGRWNKQMAAGMLAGYQGTYDELRKRWSDFKKIIDICFAKYVMGAETKDEGDDEIIFAVCGVRGFIRFTHDLKNGYLEYGALLPGGGPDRIRRMPLRRLSFDRVGNVENEYTIHSSEEWSFALLHIRTLAVVMPELVRAYYGTSASAVERKDIS